MKTFFLFVAIVATLSFQFIDATNTFWVPIEEASHSLDNSLELKRQGIKILACRCQMQGEILTGQIIGKECHIRTNGISYVEKKFEVLVASNNKLKVI